MNRVFAYNDLSSADLIIDAIYEGAPGSALSGEPISKLLPGTGNMGGFRASGKGQQKNWVVLYTTGEDHDWPDTLDLNTGQFVYYGDNKTPGHELHDTSAGGNKILRNVFDQLHNSPLINNSIPPFFIFKKHPTKVSARSVQFKGIAVPGFSGLSATEDLVAVWKSSKGQRFQNYRSVFTVLDIALAPRSWLKDIAQSTNAPKIWRDWQSKGKYTPLTAEPTKVIRTAEQQSPDTALKSKLLEKIWDHFQDADRLFEKFAARIYQMTDQRVIIDEITRGVIDGGRDAIGRYLLGMSDDPVYAEFSLEAKCYRPTIKGLSPVTVKVEDVARLISRIRHRQFGVLVTTSLVAPQAYKEVRQDKHPIIFISGKDITEILIKNGYGTPELLSELLVKEFAA